MPLAAPMSRAGKVAPPRETGQRHDGGQPIAHHQQQGTRGAAGGRFLGWWVWLFIHVRVLTGYRSRIGAVGWWFAFTCGIHRERTFAYAMPLEVGPDRELPESTLSESLGR